MRKVVHILWMIAIVIVSPTRSNAEDDHSKGAGAVFVMTNAADRNEIISLKRAADGSLQEGRRSATGGRGWRRDRSSGISRLPYSQPRSLFSLRG